MLCIAVCDDEMLECCKIAEKIKTILGKRKVPCAIKQFYSGQELLNTTEHFDIIFLDIIMKDLSGMKTAELFREKEFDRMLVFISSSREYVFEAYDVEAFGYLVKPLDTRKLEKVLQRAIKKIEDQSQEFIIVSRERQQKKLFLNNIYYFEVKGRKIYAHGVSGIFTYYEQMGNLENQLSGKDFFRCHKSYLVNLKYVAGYNKQEAVLDNGEKISIAKRRYEEFGKEILAYMRKSGGIL